MHNRLSMNSKSLQAASPEIYKELFSRSTVVTSTSRMFTWAGEYSEMFGGLNIMQKLPLKIYVGLEPIDTQEIKIGLFKTFFPAKAGFSDSVFNNIAEKELAKFLYSILPDLGYKNNPKGFLIHIISELPLECGLGSVGTLAGALSSALFLYFGQINPEMIKNWQSYPAQKLIDDPKLKFRAVHQLAWEMEAVLDLFPVSGVRSFTSLISSTHPVVYFTKKDKSVENIDFIKHASDSEESRKIISKTRYWAFRYEEIFKFKCLISWPIDFGLIFSGDYRVTGNILRSIGGVRESLNQSADYIKKEFGESLNDVTNKDNLPAFYKTCLEEGGEGLWNKYTTTMSIASMQVLKGFRDLFTSGASDEPFFRAINLGNNMLKLLDVSTPTIDFICSYLQDRIRSTRENPEMVAVKLTGAGKGGDVLFAVPYGSLRTMIDQIVEKLREKTGKDIWLDYTSWIDGYGGEGLSVEQFLDQGIYSSFISKGSVYLKTYDKRGNASSRILSLEAFETEKKKIDFLIDKVKDEIYLQGKRLTSKELHSVTTTIDILEILLANPSKSIANIQLPESSYAEDRNELQSKIAIPLKRAVKKYTSKELNFTVSGGLTEFHLNFSSSDLEIAVLEKIV